MHMGRIMTELQLVLIVWNDAVEMQSGWHDMEDIKKHAITKCKTVGWLIDKNEERIVIASTVEGPADSLSGGSVHAIPTDWCQSIQPLSTYIPPNY